MKKVIVSMCEGGIDSSDVFFSGGALLACSVQCAIAVTV
jgi:hypothetical protein